MLLRFADVFHRQTSGIASGLAFDAALKDSAARTAALDRVVDVLAAEGRLSAWRGERYAIATNLSAPVRAALPSCTVAA